jgi:hypothetical protein
MISEKDPPYRMPSGYLVAESALKELEMRDDKYVCPRTNRTFVREDLRKVFFS